MPRTYRFDHFTVGQHETDGHFAAVEKQHLHAGDSASSSHDGLRYGKRFAQTEEFLNARKMAAQLQEASDKDELESDPALKKMYEDLQSLSEKEGPEIRSTSSSEAKRSPASRASHLHASRMPETRDQPIAHRIQDVLDEAERNFRTLVTSARIFRDASIRLLLAPRDAARSLIR